MSGHMGYDCLPYCFLRHDFNIFILSAEIPLPYMVSLRPERSYVYGAKGNRKTVIPVHRMFQISGGYDCVRKSWTEHLHACPKAPSLLKYLIDVRSYFSVGYSLSATRLSVPVGISSKLEICLDNFPLSIVNEMKPNAFSLSIVL